MILVQREANLPKELEGLRAAVLLTLRANHYVHEFAHPEDLEAFLDGKVLREMVELGYPRGLTRIVLFTFDTTAIRVCAHRMIPGGSFITMRLPHAWKALGEKVPELEAWARRIEPNWNELSKGL